MTPPPTACSVNRQKCGAIMMCLQLTHFHTAGEMREREKVVFPEIRLDKKMAYLRRHLLKTAH